MLSWRSFKIEDKPLIDEYVGRYAALNCAVTFNNCFIWNPRGEWCLFEDVLLLRFFYGEDKVAYYEPLGDPSFDVDRVVEQLMEDAHSKGQPLRFTHTSEAFTRRLQQSRSATQLHIYINRNAADYIYLAERLRTLRGSNLQPKRNHVNKFIRLYDYRVEPLTSHHYEQVKALTDLWVGAKEDGKGQVSQLELDGMKAVFENFEQLDIHGVALFVEDRLVAYSYGCKVNDEVFDVNVEKADTSYEGAYAMINRMMAESLPASCVYVNREDDMGIPGLRKAKLSYDPEIIFNKWCAVEKQSDEYAIIRLWHEVFGDEESFIMTYLNNFFTNDNMVCERRDEKIVSMVHIPRFANRFGNIGYIYAVATDSTCRGEGLGVKLTREALAKAYERGDLMCAVIPADEHLAQNNSRMFNFAYGDLQSRLQFRLPISFDLGTGSADQDRPMYRILNPYEYMQRCMDYYEDCQFDFELADDIIQNNSGRYYLKDGKVCFERCDVECMNNPISVDELFRSWPLEDPFLVLE